MIGLILKIGMLAVLAGVGLRLTFWAVDIVEQILHHPEEVAILRPLLESDDGVERVLQVEETDHGLVLRDKNAISTFFLVVVLIVLFSAIGRVIAACIGGAVRLLGSIDFGRERKPRDAD